nr:MAG TPA: hypothetical protein [Caudoviricetes sp.]
MPDNLFDILTAGEQTCTRPEPTQSPTKKNHRRKTLCLELSDHYLYRRAFSECSLLDACGSFDFAPGHSYHFITAGDVDALSYLKAILRQQPLDYCLFSTWCMAAEDILQFDQWLQEGKIRRLDAYVGEIFPNSYKVEYALLKECFARNTGGGELPFSAIIPKFSPDTARVSPSGSKPRQTSTPTREPKTGASQSDAKYTNSIARISTV